MKYYEYREYYEKLLVSSKQIENFICKKNILDCKNNTEDASESILHVQSIKSLQNICITFEFDK